MLSLSSGHRTYNRSHRRSLAGVRDRVCDCESRIRLRQSVSCHAEFCTSSPDSLENAAARRPSSRLLSRYSAGLGIETAVLTTDQGARNGEQAIALEPAGRLQMTAVKGPDAHQSTHRHFAAPLCRQNSTNATSFTFTPSLPIQSTWHYFRGGDAAETPFGAAALWPLASL